VCGVEITRTQKVKSKPFWLAFYFSDWLLQMAVYERGY